MAGVAVERVGGCVVRHEFCEWLGMYVVTVDIVRIGFMSTGPIYVSMKPGSVGGMRQSAATFALDACVPGYHMEMYAPDGIDPFWWFNSDVEDDINRLSGVDIDEPGELVREAVGAPDGAS